MTAPIQEPNLYRHTSGLQWGQNQLFRRPAPSVDSCCPWQTAIAYDSTTGSGTGTINNNILSSIFFDQTFLSAGATAFNVSNDTTPIELLLDGWYLFYLDFEWAGLGFADVRYYTLTFQFQADNDSQIDVSGNESAPFEASYHRTWGPLYFRGSTLSPNTSVRVWHAAGSTQTLAGVLLTAMYIGPDLDPTAFPPF